MLQSAQKTLTESDVKFEHRLWSTSVQCVHASATEPADIKECMKAF